MLTDGRNPLSPGGLEQFGYVVECTLRPSEQHPTGARVWLTEPKPNRPYTWTYDLTQAWIWDVYYMARDTAAAVNCYRWRTLLPEARVRTYDDDYRASVALGI